MTDRVPADRIEEIVGVSRHARAHWARAVSEEQTVYILHSTNCVEMFGNKDFEQCFFRKALTRGIDLETWKDMQDKPVHVAVYNGRLEPARVG